MRKAIIGAALLLLGVSTVAVAAVPDGNGVIPACRNTRDGGLRVIDTAAGQKCSKGETPLNWNQTGPAGPPGASLVLIDAAGRTVGPYLGGASVGIPEVFYAGYLWHVSATDGQFRGAKTLHTMWWTSTDCTGQPYIRLAGPGGVDGNSWWTHADVDYALTQATLAWGSEAYVPTWPAVDLRQLNSWRSDATDVCNMNVGGVTDYSGPYVPLTKVATPAPVPAPLSLGMQ
jgi:hypothetical protein